MLTNMRNKPYFPEHLRLFIYSYVDTKTCITHISQLNKRERESLKNSYLVREGRRHHFKISDKDLLPAHRIKRIVDPQGGVVQEMPHGTYLSIFDQL